MFFQRYFICIVFKAIGTRLFRGTILGGTILGGTILGGTIFGVAYL